MLLRTSAFLSVFASVLVFFVASSFIHAATTCPQKGEEPITDALRSLTNLVGIPASATCWNPADPNTGRDIADAKQYLRSILCTQDRDNYGGYGPDGTIRELNPKFASCAAKFLKEMSAKVPGTMRLANGGANSLCIREGARTVAKQNEYVSRGVIACTKGAGCEHPRGIAIDVNTTSDNGYQMLHTAAKDYGVNFYLGFKDKYHFVPRSDGCSTAGYRPNDATATTPPTPPTSTLANAFRQALGLPQQQQTPPSIPQQMLPQQQSPLSAFQTPTTIDSGAIASPILNDTPISTTGGNAANLLEQLAFGTSSTTTVATSTFSVFVSGQNAAQITSTQQQQSTTSTTTIQSGVISQQTFVSPDLAHQTAVSQQTRTQQILETLRQVLLRMLQYLRPFGSRTTQEVLE